MSDQPIVTASDLKNRIAEAKANGTDPLDVIALYEQLVVELDKPRIARSKMTPEEKRAHRRERREARKRGEYIRTGRQWTDEQRAKIEASWTPERRAAASEKAAGRVPSEETLERVRAAAARRKAEKEAKEARLAELEAMLASGQLVAVGEDAPKGRNKRG